MLLLKLEVLDDAGWVGRIVEWNTRRVRHRGERRAFGERVWRKDGGWRRQSQEREETAPVHDAGGVGVPAVMVA